MSKKNSTPNLEGLSIEELLDMKSNIDKQIKKLQRAEKKALLKQMDAMAKNAGFNSAADLVSAGRAPRKDKGTKSPPMYKHPTEEKTWSGKGRAPDWIKEYEKKRGKSRDDLLIKK